MPVNPKVQPGGGANDIQVGASGAFVGGRGTLDSGGNMALIGLISNSIPTATNTPLVAKFLAPNTIAAGAGFGVSGYFGVAASGYNAGVWQFTYVGAGNIGNFLGLGVYGFTLPLRVFADHVAIAIPASQPASPSNGYAEFWIDEGTGNLKISAMQSDGTARTYTLPPD